jgi:hypothetical protein
VILEQWLAGAIIATGGPTLRAFVGNGGWTGVRALWAAHAPLLLLVGVAFGGLMAFVFGVLTWTRMERLYTSQVSTVDSPGPRPARR